MNRQALLLSLVAVACLLLLVMLGRARIVQAAHAEWQARERLQQAGEEVGELQRLRAGHVQVGTSRRPDADLVEQVQQALADQGLPLTAFQGVTPREDRQQRGSDVRVQAVQVRFEGLEPAEFGSFLAAWHSLGTPWYVAEVQLAHQREAAASNRGRRPQRAGQTGMDANSYAITVLLTAPYVDPTGG